MQRPLFLHFEEDPETYAIQTRLSAGARSARRAGDRGREKRLDDIPARGRGVGACLVGVERYAGGADVTVAAPFGQPPVFYRAGSAYAALFEGIPSA